MSTIFPSEKLATQVLVCLIGCFEVLEVLLGELCFPSEKLAAQVLVCLSVGLKCWKFCWESCVYTVVCEYYLPFREVGCPGACVPIGVGLKCWKFCWESCVSLQRSWLPRYFCALSVGLKCWKFCWESCVYTVVCKYYLPFREVGCPGTCVPYRLV